MRPKDYMQRALQLAQNGLGYVSPNPMVGAVIVHNDVVIGEGWHKRFGGPHAEVEAIQSVKDHGKLTESCMYVTLEPCSHYGKTPPCADLLVQKGIKKVVVAMEDPNPLVAGRGIEKMKQAGIEVELGLLEDEAKRLNKRFLTGQLQHRPYIILKWAQTADGFIAPALEASREEKQISNAMSQWVVHKWRAQEDAIMVGFNTLKYDNPRLNVRLIDTHKQPTRITLDERGTVTGGYHFFDGTQSSFVFNYIKEEEVEGHRFLHIRQDSDALKQLFARLWEEGIGSLIVEGGAKLLEKILVANLWDEARVCVSPKQFGTGIRAPFLHQAPSESFFLDEDAWHLVPNRLYQTEV